jgi:hypothetical protein
VDLNAVDAINKRINELCADEANGCIETPGNTKRSIFKARDVFQEIYKNANDNNATADVQLDALEKCYGVRKKNYVSCTGLVTSGVYVLFPPSFTGAIGTSSNFEVKDTDDELIGIANIAASQENKVTASFGQSTATISSVKYTNTQIPNGTDIIIVIKAPTSGGGDIAMKVAKINTTVPFTLDDITPLISYSKIYDSANTGTNRLTGSGTAIRLESARFPGMFLTITSELSRVLTLFSYETNTPPIQYTYSSLVLTAPTSSNGDTAIYALNVRGTSDYITHTTGTISFRSYTSAMTNNTWVLRPAINGFAGLITIESATMPQTYISVTDTKGVVLKYGGSSTTDGLTEYEKVLTCWRIHPATA